MGFKTLRKISEKMEAAISEDNVDAFSSLLKDYKTTYDQMVQRQRKEGLVYPNHHNFLHDKYYSLDYYVYRATENHALKIVNYLIENEDVDMHLTHGYWQSGSSPHKSFMAALLKRKGNEGDSMSEEQTIFLEKLLQLRVDADSPKYLEKDLKYAIRRGPVVVNMILKSYPHIDRNKYLELALKETDDANVIKLFITDKSDVNKLLNQIFSDSNSIHTKINRIKALIDAGADPNGRCETHGQDQEYLQYTSSNSRYIKNRSYMFIAASLNNYELLHILHRAGGLLYPHYGTGKFVHNFLKEDGYIVPENEIQVRATYEDFLAVENKFDENARLIALASLDVKNTKNERGVFYGVYMDILVLLAVYTADKRIKDPHKIAQKVIQETIAQKDRPFRPLEPGVSVPHDLALKYINRLNRSKSTTRYRDGLTKEDAENFTLPFLRSSRGDNRLVNYKIAQSILNDLIKDPLQKPAIMSQIKEDGIFMRYTGDDRKVHTIRSFELIRVIKELMKQFPEEKPGFRNK